MIKPMDVTPNVISALKFLRVHIATDARPQVRQAFRDLEDAGVFAEIDEVTDGDAVPGLLADSAARSLADEHGARDHELRDPAGYLRSVRNAQGA